MVGNVVRKSGIPKPKFSKFGEIQKGDLVVYYATKDKVVVGIFEVVSDIGYLRNDSHWKEIMIYKIKPFELPVTGKYLDFKKLVTDHTVQFDIFPKKKNWGNYLQGRTCLLLTNRDFLIVKNAISHDKYLRSTSEIDATTTRWHEKLFRQTRFQSCQKSFVPIE